MLPTFKTDRLTLREISPDDGPELQAYQKRPENWRFQAVDPSEYSDGNRIERYMQFRGSGEERRLHAYVARAVPNDQLLGEVGISKTYPGTAAIGFSVDPGQWNRGYATELALFAISFGFDHLNLHRITASVAVENTASCRVLEKAGMVREGTARDCIKAQGRWWTEHQYAILKGDFSACPHFPNPNTENSK